MWPNRRARYKLAIQPEEEETSHTHFGDPVGKLICTEHYPSLYSHSAQGEEALGLLLWTLLMPTETEAKISGHLATEMSSSIL